jgi:Ca2+/H+ antiporter, TMEM165/GDT1 family
MRRSTWAKRILFIILVVPIAIFVFGEIVMLLWNNVLSPVLHISTITFWQGLGLLVLSKIFFGSFGGRGGPRGSYWKQRMMWNNMTPEQREKFKEECKDRGRKWGRQSWGSATEAEQRQ